MTANGEHIAELLAELEVRGGRSHIEVRAELAGYGREAVEYLLGLPPDRGGVLWGCYEHFGVEALEPMVQRLQCELTGQDRDRVLYAIGKLNVPDRAVFLPYLEHPVAAVREGGLKGFEDRREVALEYKDSILPLLADPDENVRIGAYNALGSGGMEILDFIAEARRVAPQRARPYLREMLLEMVGFPGVDARDQAAIRRFIDVRAIGEQPESMHLCGTWLAVPTTDQDAVLEAFGLSDPMPVTIRLGAAAWNRDHHDWYEHNDCRRAYVTPAFDGWTLVFGKSPEAAHSSGNEAHRDALCDEAVRLSTRFGEAHWYGASCGDGWTAWCIARDGQIARFFDNFEEEGSAIGEPEKATHSTQVAAELSVNPESLGPHTRVQGRGVLALTSCGRERGAPTGVLEV
ncbi:hypothetical protein [Actinospica robiniae]|uniref:hypothetical protein n=1 Tax=Actinospica robiniae TaxID=304901 RepID=UPI0012FC8227|nr:hypothetical protein [Actinospica robiniae]